MPIEMRVNFTSRWFSSAGIGQNRKMLIALAPFPRTRALFRLRPQHANLQFIFARFCAPIRRLSLLSLFLYTSSWQHEESAFCAGAALLLSC